MTDLPPDASDLRHATTVSIDGHAVVITGPSGSGKSALALELMARGAELIADDATRLWRDGDSLWAGAPATLPAAIEARGIGLLMARPAPPAPVLLVIDMGQTESARLPEPKTTEILGQKVALVHKVAHAHFPAAILQYVKARGAMLS